MAVWLVIFNQYYKPALKFKFETSEEQTISSLKK